MLFITMLWLLDAYGVQGNALNFGNTWSVFWAIQNATITAVIDCVKGQMLRSLGKLVIPEFIDII